MRKLKKGIIHNINIDEINEVDEGNDNIGAEDLAYVEEAEISLSEYSVYDNNEKCFQQI